MRFHPIATAAVLLVSSLAVASVHAADRNYLIARTGLYNLLDSSNEGRDFDTTASDVINIEYEFHRKVGMSFGAEYLSFSNPYTLGASDYTAYSQFAIGNIKQYFRHTDRFSSFLGAGAGFGTVETREDGGSFDSDDVSGPIFQLRGGVMYRMAQLALYAEVRQVNAKIVSDIGDRDNIDLSGRGVFGGFAFIF
jgi:hypothetical protein